MKYNSIHLLRFIAIFFITLSHLKPLLPGVLSFFASGGAVGCAIFFFCSGYTLNLSLSKKNTDFLPFLFKRFISILPPIWLFYLLINVIAEPSYTLFDFLFPLSKYWFLQAIVVFYFIFYFVKKYLYKQLKIIVVILFILVTIVYFFNDHSVWIIDYARNKTFIHWIYYFAIMLIGAYLSSQDSSLPIIKHRIFKEFIWVTISVIFAYSLKFLVQKGIVNCNYQLLFPFILFFSTIKFYRLFILLVEKTKRFSSIIIYISNITLFIYVVQIYIIYSFSRFEFPYGLIGGILLILFTASLLNYLINRIYKVLKYAYNNIKFLF